MQSLTSDNSGFNKLKSILFLGLSCNHTTVFGCILTWILLQKNEWLYEWTHIFLLVICVAPFFMGDAVNNYVLGRIKLEADNNWDDILIVDSAKKRISKFFNYYRALSIASAYGTAALFVINAIKKSYPDWLVPTVLSVMAIHFILALLNIIKGIAPVIPQYKKQGLIYRGAFIIIASLIWYFLFNKQFSGNFSHLFIFTSGMLYFVFCGMMHPLPAKGSLFQSIIKESIISQAQADARERTNSQEQLLFNINAHEVEDASIIHSETNSSESMTSENPESSISIPNSSESVSSAKKDSETISEAIIVTESNNGEAINEQQ